MNTEITQLLAQGYTLITPTNRLSRYLQNRYAALQIEQGRHAWETPDCIPWTGWCQRQFQALELRHDQTRLLLTKYQQQWLWQQIVLSSPLAKKLLQTTSTLKLALQSYEICKSWHITIFPEDIYLNEDAFAFKTWARDYQDCMDRNNWLDNANLPDYLSENLSAGSHATGRIALYGFDEITPQQKRLTEALRKAGSIVVEIKLKKKNLSAGLYAFSDSRAEISTVANWARQILTDDPNASIGVIVPNLKKLRQNFAYGFDAVLTPESLIKHHNNTGKPYNISLGRPLSDYPLVHAALGILALGKRKQPLNAIGVLLRSPFIQGAGSEHSKRSLFDALLRKLGERELSLKTIFRIAENHCEKHEMCDGFINSLKDFDIQLLSSPRHQTARDWAKTFTNLLRCFSWPGERTLDSDEYQTISAWNDALKQFAALESVSKPLNYQTAYTYLIKIVNDISFQPETSEVPIQILGTTGAAGMQFDYLWITGLHDQAWPAPVQPNPFIPLRLQREKGLPYASAENHLAHTQQITRSLLYSSAEVMLSYPMQEGDRRLRPSPIVKQYSDSQPAPGIVIQADYKKQVFNSGKLEIFIDDVAPAIKQGQMVSGGAAIFKDQAACPFKGFAKHRLYAERLSTAEIGLDPAERGLLAHRALQYLWQRLKTMDNLLQWSSTELDNLVHSVVSEAIKQQSKQQPESFTERFTQLEQQRLVRLLNEWLMIERKRAPFKVRETEQWHTVAIDELEIHMRIDRIDELNDGRLVILDYKTGRASISDWESERPDEPQLPLYAIAGAGTGKKEIAAIAFAKLKRGELQFIGLAEDNDLLPGVTANPDQGLADKFREWEIVLNRLAGEFREGKARVEPRNKLACRRCDLHFFCRIYEKTTEITESYIDD